MIHNNIFCVATIGRCTVIVPAVIGLDIALEAVVFLTGLARLALVAAVDKRKKKKTPPDKDSADEFDWRRRRELA